MQYEAEWNDMEWSGLGTINEEDEWGDAEEHDKEEKGDDAEEDDKDRKGDDEDQCLDANRSHLLADSDVAFDF